MIKGLCAEGLLHKSGEVLYEVIMHGVGDTTALRECVTEICKNDGRGEEIETAIHEPSWIQTSSKTCINVFICTLVKTITIAYSYLVVTRSRSNYIFDKLQETEGFVLGVVMEQLTKREGVNRFAGFNLPILILRVPLMLI